MYIYTRVCGCLLACVRGSVRVCVCVTVCARVCQFLYALQGSFSQLLYQCGRAIPHERSNNLGCIEYPDTGAAGANSAQIIKST